MDALATVFYLIVCLARLCYYVFRTTTALLAPADRSSELKFAGLFRIAGIAGVVGLFAIQVHWNWGGQGFADVADDYIWGTFLVLTPLYAAGALILGTVILFASTSANRYRQNAVHLVIPLGKMAGSAGVILAFWAVGKGLTYGMGRWTTEGDAWLSTQPILVQLVLIVLLVLAAFVLAVAVLALVFAFLTFLAALAVSSSRDLFGASDGHPYLRALTSIILALWSIALAIWGIEQGGVDQHYPLAITLLLLSCGPVFSMATSLFEMHCLNKAGFNIREPKRSVGTARPGRLR